jgi:hypothetical protein
MKKSVTIAKIWDKESSTQTFNYAADTPIGHIKRHLASELAYARKGIASVMNPGHHKIALTITLDSSTGIKDEEVADLTKFLANL